MAAHSALRKIKRQVCSASNPQPPPAHRAAGPSFPFLCFPPGYQAIFFFSIFIFSFYLIFVFVFFFSFPKSNLPIRLSFGCFLQNSLLSLLCLSFSLLSLHSLISLFLIYQLLPLVYSAFASLLFSCNSI